MAIRDDWRHGVDLERCDQDQIDLKLADTAFGIGQDIAARDREIVEMSPSFIYR